MSGLREVLANHREDPVYPDTCLCETQAAPDREGHYSDHLETAVLDWLRARLASDEVRGDVAEAVSESIAQSNWLGDPADGETAADAALTAVLAALGQEGACEHEWFVEPRRVCERDGTEVCARCGERRPVDDEGRPGAQEEGK